MRHKKAQRRVVVPDKIHNSILVTRLMNNLMVDGKKTIAQKIVYTAFEIIAKKEQQPLDVLEKAIQNIAPKVEVKARRVGGASYQVPIEVRSDRKMSLAIRWLLESTAKKSNKEFHTFAEKLATELMDAAVGQGEAMKKKEVMHRQAEANKAFASFRW